MVKKNMRALGLICLLNVGHSFAMEPLSSEKKDFICSVNGDSRNAGQVAMLECPDDLKTIQWNDFLKAFSTAKQVMYVKNKEVKSKNPHDEIDCFYKFDLYGYDVQISNNSYCTVKNVKNKGIKINEKNEIEYSHIERNRCVYEIMDYVHPDNVNKYYLIGLSFIKKDTNILIQNENKTIQKENIYKMWLIKQAMEDAAEERMEEVFPKDVRNIIAQILHEVTNNPVLDGQLVCTTNMGIKVTYKMKDLVNREWNIDLSGKKFLGCVSNYLLITTDPEKFFKFDIKSERLVILIAPRFLIKDKLETTAWPFEPIMADWNVDQAPIGMFWRMEFWENRNNYDYQTSRSLLSISKNSLYDNLYGARRHNMYHRTWLLDQIMSNSHLAKNFMFISSQS